MSEQYATVTVSCLTKNCLNENIGLEIKVFYPAGEVMCGTCGNKISFVMPEKPDEPLA